MRVAAIVSNLQKYSSLFGVNSVRYEAPSFDLILRINPRCAWVALSLMTYRCALGDYETRRGTLCVVFRIQCRRNVPGACPHSCQGRHDDPVWHLDGPELQWSE